MSSSSPALVSVDWGTSAFRARLAAADGAALDAVEAEVGAVGLASGAHEAFLETQIGDWMRRFPGLPIVMSGMVGSRQGWVEAPYVRCPAGAAEIAAAMATVPATRLGRVVVVPGLSARDARGAPDVMRGEETQILGALGATRPRRRPVRAARHAFEMGAGRSGPHRRLRHLHDRRSLRRAEGPHLARPVDGAARPTPLRRRRLRARPRRFRRARTAGRSAARDLHDPHARPVRRSCRRTRSPTISPAC